MKPVRKLTPVTESRKVGIQTLTDTDLRKIVSLAKGEAWSAVEKYSRVLSQQLMEEAMDSAEFTDGCAQQVVLRSKYLIEGIQTIAASPKLAGIEQSERKKLTDSEEK